MIHPDAEPGGSDTLAATEDRLSSVPPWILSAANRLLRYPFEPWRFGDSIGFEALLAISKTLSNDRWLAFAWGFARCWGTRPGIPTARDRVAPGRTLTEIATMTGDSRLLDVAVRLAEAVAGQRRLHGVLITHDAVPLRHPYSLEAVVPGDVTKISRSESGVFVDCLHFDPPFLCELGRVTGITEWLDAGVEQTLAYCRLLQDEETGIFAHFALESSERTFGYGWSRGQGWALLGLLDVVESLPSTHRDAEQVRAAIRALLTGLEATQRADGHWHILVHDPESGIESSAAAFASAALERGFETGIIDEDRWREMAERSWAATASSVSDGVLLGVSAAVRCSTLPSHYAFVPAGGVQPWGQGPLIIAALARARQGKDVTIKAVAT